jgi:excisionase family DNA binding protein
MSEKNLIKAADVAAMMGNCHVQTVYKMAARGTLPSVKINSWRRFRAADVAAWLEKKGGASHE